MNKKGFVIETIAFIVIGIIVVLLFGGLIYGVGLVNNALSNTELDTPGVNITSASSMTFGSLHTGMLNLKIMAVVLLIGYVIATFITAYFSAKHPVWIFLYLLMSIILVIFSVYVSNSYETMKANPTIATITSGFSAAEFIVLHLPIFVTIIALGGIMLSVVGMMAARRLLEQ